MKHRATRKHRRVSRKTRRLRRGGAGFNICTAPESLIKRFNNEKEHCRNTGKGMLYGCKNSKRCKYSNHYKNCRPIMKDPCWD